MKPLSFFYLIYGHSIVKIVNHVFSVLRAFFLSYCEDKTKKSDKLFVCYVKNL